MPSKEGDRLALYSLAVRESSLKRLRLVDNGKENWRIAPKTMSFADVAQHLINSDKWLFKKLEIKTLNAEMGEAGKINIKKRSENIALLEELIAKGHARAS